MSKIMKILRQVDNYSLVVSSQSESKTLKYYIDNGEDVSEYMDEFQISPLLSYNDGDFKEFCLNIF